MGWRRLLEPWRQLHPGQIGAAVGLVLISYGLRAVRIYDYFHATVHGRFAACLKLVLLHNLFNNLLPMRGGELSFPLLMSRYFSTPALHSVPALLWFRLLDLHALIMLALLVWTGFAATPWPAGALALWLPLPLLGFVAARRGVLRMPARLRIRLSTWARSAREGLPQTPAAFWRAWGWTLLNWVVKLGVFAWVLQLFVDIPPGAALLGAVTGDISSVLPIHGVAGAGTYEAGVVAGLLPFHINASQALQGAVNLHLFLLGSTLIGGMLSLLLRGRGHG